MYNIQIALGARSYPVFIDEGLIEKIGGIIPSSGSNALVTTPIINEIYGEKVQSQLENCEIIMVPDGEEAKQWNVAEELIGKLLDAGVDRKSTLIALGGGTVGDLTGFVASIYMRGISVIHIPTTLLAMVDSSIGGKTAINHPKGKNLVGAFHQPSKVLIDPTLLKTLPDREIRSGIAEVIKYCVISDLELFQILELKRPESLTIHDFAEIIARCASIKARYVEEDEEDKMGIRVALNYGHTLGHAIEIFSSHLINHGEGVSIGMQTAASIALKNGLLTNSDYNRIVDLLTDYGLPTNLPNLDVDKIIEVMHRDKKSEKSRIRFVLPTGIGKKPILTDVDEVRIREALEENK